jgi:two-component system NtrC family sensor kinase
MSLLGKLINLKLRIKFVLPIAVLIIASTLVISGYLINRQLEGFRRELEASGETMIRILAMQAETGVIFESRVELDELLGQLLAFENVQYAEIASMDGTVLSSIGAWHDNQIKSRKPMAQTDFKQNPSANFYVIDSRGREFIELRHPIFSRTEQVDREKLGMTSGIDHRVTRNYVTEEIGSMRVVLSLDKVKESIGEARTTANILTLLVLILTIFVLTLIVGAVTKPLKMLVAVTDQVSRGDLDQKVNINQDDEIGQLANTFNQMVDSLRQSRVEIEEYNRNLEEKIVERTLALETAQSQLVQSEKMSAIGQLAAGVAHELNNPLGGILGYAQFALEKMRRQVEKDAKSPEMDSYIRYLTDIECQSRRCKNIVQNLLRFSRSSRTTDFEEVDINKVIDETRTFVEHQLHMNQISLKVDLAPKLPLINGNAGQLQQVFTNMIINAMHASPSDSEITITTRCSPALGEFGGAIEVLFTDQGSGIAPEHLTKIFEPFFTTKEVGKGTGLGLSVSYGIIKDHGGEIRVESEVGRGTTFTIVLPVQKPTTASDNQNKEFLDALNSRP